MPHGATGHANGRGLANGRTPVGERHASRASGGTLI